MITVTCPPVASTLAKARLKHDQFNTARQGKTESLDSGVTSHFNKDTDDLPITWSSTNCASGIQTNQTHCRQSTAALATIFQWSIHNRHPIITHQLTLNVGVLANNWYTTISTHIPKLQWSTMPMMSTFNKKRMHFSKDGATRIYSGKFPWGKKTKETMKRVSQTTDQTNIFNQQSEQTAINWTSSPILTHLAQFPDKVYAPQDYKPWDPNHCRRAHNSKHKQIISRVKWNAKGKHKTIMATDVLN